MTITTADGKVAEGLEQAPFEPIAVVGVGAMMPDADDVEQFWRWWRPIHVVLIQQFRWNGWRHGRVHLIANCNPKWPTKNNNKENKNGSAREPNN